MKVERFIKEYANYKKQATMNCELMKPEIKDRICKYIDRVIVMKEKGFITIDESIQSISNAESQIKEGNTMNKIKLTKMEIEYLQPRFDEYGMDYTSDEIVQLLWFYWASSIPLGEAEERCKQIKKNGWEV